MMKGIIVLNKRDETVPKSITLTYNGKKNREDDKRFYIGRGSVLGNPFTHIPIQNTQAQFQVATRTDAIKCFKRYLKQKLEEKDEAIINELNKMLDDYKQTGRIFLICYCKPLACHGDVIKEFILKKVKTGERF